MILSIVGFFVGFAVGLFLYAQILLPLVYSFPLSIMYVSRGELKFGAILFQFVPILIWSVVLTVVGLLLSFVAPSMIDFLINDPGVILGQLASILALGFNFVRSSGRADMKSDFMQSTYTRFKKN